MKNILLLSCLTFLSVGCIPSQAAPEGEGDVFRSNAEVTTAMKDPKYEHDHAYRQDVQDKLERSNVFKGGVV